VSPPACSVRSVSLLKQHKENVSALGAEGFVAAHESFLDELAYMERDPLDGLSAAERAAYTAFFSQCQRRYLAIREREAACQLLAVADGIASSAIEMLGTGFPLDAYQRVSDLADMVDFSVCRRAVMVGSGAFPATLLWLSDHFPELRCTGLDIDARCVDMATRLMRALDITNIQFEAIDGRSYDFDGTHFVYLANHVVGKKAVLEQATRSFSVVQIVVREPTRRGELLAESVSGDLPGGWTAGKKGVESSTFLSYDLFLRRL
jgi:hypothetical protein